MAVTDEEKPVELWGNSFTSQKLSEQLPEKTPEQWELWLRNNRNQSRQVPYRIPFQRISNGTFYSPDEIAKFLDYEKSRQLGVRKLTGRSAEVMRAYGIGTASGSATGRTLTIVGVFQQEDPITGRPYVQLITGDPLMVYRLEPEQAISFASDLVNAATPNS